MLAVTTEPAAALNPQITAAIITAAATIITGAIAAVVIFSQGRKALTAHEVQSRKALDDHRQRIVDERRLDAYLRLSRLLVAACTRFGDWPRLFGHVNQALEKTRNHCEAHTLLLGEIAAEFISFYDDQFTPWYTGEDGKDPTKQKPIPAIPKQMISACEDFRDRVRRIIDRNFPVAEPDV